jgi:hypothetical protein
MLEQLQKKGEYETYAYLGRSVPVREKSKSQALRQEHA